MKQLSHALVEQKEKQTTETTDIKCLFKQVNENSDKKKRPKKKKKNKTKQKRNKSICNACKAWN